MRFLRREKTKNIDEGEPQASQEQQERMASVIVAAMSRVIRRPGEIISNRIGNRPVLRWFVAHIVVPAPAFAGLAGVYPAYEAIEPTAGPAAILPIVLAAGLLTGEAVVTRDTVRKGHAPGAPEGEQGEAA